MGDMLHNFGVNKVEKLRRSCFDFNMRQTQEQMQGALVPLCWHMVTPSEVWSCKAHSFNRFLLTLAKPLFADVYFTYGFYFVPFRILFKDYEKMFGDGSPQEWVNWTEYIIPSMNMLLDGNALSGEYFGTGYDGMVPGSASVISTGYLFSKVGNLANYCGLPHFKQNNNGNTRNKEINIAPLLAYERIWSDMYRDENYQNEDPDLAKAKAFTPGSSGARTNLRLGLHYANRFHDYFSSLLPNTQKGPDVALASHLVALDQLYDLVREGTSDYPEDVTIQFGDASKTLLTGGTLGLVHNSVSLISGTPSSTQAIQSTNLGIDISVDELRYAFALKRARERNARVGSRYVEAMLGTFEAHLSNAIAQRAEFLGGNTIKLNITSVPSTSEDAPGKLGAFSATRDDSSVFVKQFNEPGIVMAVGCYRIKHRYSQGIDRQFTKLRRYDFYDPAFAHISEQPHYASELNCMNANGLDFVIGFNEPWVEDLKPVDRVCGLMGFVGAPSDYKAWVPVDNFGDNDGITPDNWLPENGDEIATRCIDYNADYPTWVFGTDFIAECQVTSPRPLYSIPGYVDHLIV